MSKKVNQTLEAATNIAIISLAILFGYILVQNFLLSPSNNLVLNNPTQNNLASISQPPSGVKIGAKVDVPDVNWNSNRRTLIIYTSKACHFCTESMPFYKELAQKQVEIKTKIVVVSSNTVEASKGYFKEHGVDFLEVRRAFLVSIGVRGTPTLLLVNEKGEVLNSWIGRLSKEREREVISKL